MFVIFKYLHILTMFVAVAAAFVPEIWLHAIARRGNAAELRGYLPLAERVGRLLPVLFLVGLGFGLLAAWAGEFNFFAPWLLASYVVFAIAMATGAMLSEPWAKRLGEAAMASGDSDAPSPALTAAIHDRRGIISTAVLMTAIAVIIFLMVAKPGA